MLVDFNPFGPVTEALLFDWQELEDANCDSDTVSFFSCVFAIVRVLCWTSSKLFMHMLLTYFFCPPPLPTIAFTLTRDIKFDNFMHADILI